MEKIVRQALLFDFYGELLTEHQKSIYSDIVLNDLSYSEVARVEGISRQGVYDLVKRCDKILEDYESKLLLVEKFLDTKERVSRIHELATDLKQMTDKNCRTILMRLKQFRKRFMKATKDYRRTKL